MSERILSAGVVVVRQVDGGWRVLLLRAWNYWDFPKGMVEPGEDSLTTAKREAREETGVADLDFRWGLEFIETAPYARNKVVRYYLAATTIDVIKLPIGPGLGHAEHHEYRWLAFSEAAPLLVPRVAAVLKWARQRLG